MKTQRTKPELDVKTELYSLLLLAGGKSSRMGRDKAELLLDGKSFMECLVDKAQKLGIREKYLSGHSWEGEGIHIIPDRYGGRGPLGGMHACFLAMDTPYALVLPVDVPQIPMNVLETLLTAHGRLLSGDGKRKEEKTDRKSLRPLLLSHGSRIEPIIGIYPTALGKRIGELIEEKSAPVFRLLEETGYEICRVPVQEWEMGNINTPEDYKSLLERQKRGIEK